MDAIISGSKVLLSDGTVAHGYAAPGSRVVIDDNRHIRAQRPAVVIGGGLQKKQTFIEELPPAEAAKIITSSWRKSDAANQPSTILADVHGPLRFKRWPLYENQFYFDNGSSFSSYHEAMLGLILEYFHSGALSTAPGAWVNTLDVRAFYPYGASFERGIQQSSFQTANTITNRQFGRDDWEDVYTGLEHIVDWNKNYVVGITGQTVEREEVLMLEYEAVTRPGEWRTRTGWRIVQYYPDQLVWAGGIPIDILPRYQPESGEYYYFAEANERGTLAFWVYYTYKVWHDAVTIPGGKIFGEQITVSGSLVCIDRTTNEVLGTYRPGFEVIYYSQDHYASVTVDEWNTPMWDYFRGPYAKLTLNVPMLAADDRMVVFQYQEQQEKYPHSTYEGRSNVQSVSARVRFYLTDVTFGGWANFVPQGLEGKTTWQDGDQLNLLNNGPFIFTTASDEYAGTPQLLCAPWIFKDRLYIHTLSAPSTSMVSHSYSSGKQAVMYTYPTAVIAYTLKGKSPASVSLTDRSYRGSGQLSHDWQFYAWAPTYSYGRATSDPRVFVGDKNFSLKQTSKAKMPR